MYARMMEHSVAVLNGSFFLRNAIALADLSLWGHFVHLEAYFLTASSCCFFKKHIVTYCTYCRYNSLPKITLVSLQLGGTFSPVLELFCHWRPGNLAEQDPKMS